MSLNCSEPSLVTPDQRVGGTPDAVRCAIDERFECVFDFIRSIEGTTDQFISTDFGVSFILNLDCIRLRGMHLPIRCAIVADSNVDLRLVSEGLFSKGGNKYTFIFVISGSYPWHGPLRKEVFVFDHSAMHDMQNSRDPIEMLTMKIRKSVGVDNAIPYSASVVAGPNMFFGRHEELSRLLVEQDTHFAVIGPSQVGKSSLLWRHAHTLRRQNTNVGHRVLVINMNDGLGISSAVAAEISDSSVAAPYQPGNLRRLLKRECESLGRPELLIDECDDSCQSGDMEEIGEIAKDGLVRVVLFGRSGLLQYAGKSKSTFAQRLEKIRLGPLDENSARKLITEPMNALGLKFENSNSIDQILELTRRMPAALQFCGKKLAREAIATKQGTVKRIMIEHLSISKNNLITELGSE